MFCLVYSSDVTELKMLSETVKESEIRDIKMFSSKNDMEIWLRTNRPDIAFLHIENKNKFDIEFALKIKLLYRNIPMIILSENDDMGSFAAKNHFNGYISKPYSVSDIQNEIKYFTSVTQKLIFVKAFGNFEVFDRNKTPVRFQRKKSKELLAYLIDRKGSAVSAKEICAAIWEEDDTEKVLMSFYKVTADLQKSLNTVGAVGVFVKDKQKYYVDTDRIDCDYFRYLDGDPLAREQFMGEYMSQYYWGEFTLPKI